MVLPSERYLLRGKRVKRSISLLSFADVCTFHRKFPLHLVPEENPPQLFCQIDNILRQMTVGLEEHLFEKTEITLSKSEDWLLFRFYSLLKVHIDEDRLKIDIMLKNILNVIHLL